MSQQVLVELSRPGVPKVTGENYALLAEDLVRRYKKKDDHGFGKLTTTKLRGIYSLITNVSVRVETPDDYKAALPDIQYLKVRMAYEAGREKVVGQFLSETHLMSLVDAVSSLEQFKLYCRYAEAIVAYFKYFGGKDS